MRPGFFTGLGDVTVTTFSEGRPVRPHVPGHGIVLIQAGNFSFLSDGTVIEHGLDRFSPELCEVLA